MSQKPMRGPTLRPAEMTPAQYSAQLAALQRRARTVTESRTRRLHRMCNEAGLPEAMLLHNALVGEQRGRPWRGVDHSKARRARRFQDSIFEAERIVRRYHARTVRAVGSACEAVAGQAVRSR